MEDNIIWTIEKLKQFKHCYRKAKDEFKASFIFEEKEIFTSYGKYVIEYLEERFKIKE